MRRPRRPVGADVLRRFWRFVTSSHATMAVMLLVGVLLLLNVLVPQVSVFGPAEIARVIDDRPFRRFLLVTLGLSELSTSPVFVGALVLFFLNLAAVLVDRVRSTIAGLRKGPPTEAQLRALTRAPGVFAFPRPEGWSEARAASVLERVGYRVSRPAPDAVWGIRNRTAILGFPLFHLSFYFLCGGGLSLYLTRTVAGIHVAEGQPFELADATVVRAAPWGASAGGTFRVEVVHPVLEDGLPIQLGATIQPLGPGDPPPQESWVNSPAEWGSLSVLVEKVGVAPVLWLQDGEGFTVDQVALLATRSAGDRAEAPMGDGAIVVSVAPIAVGRDFPTREQLATVPIAVSVRRGAETVFDGTLRPGDFARVGPQVLKLSEVRYWVGLRLIDEKGGEWLVIGFLVAVVGLVWRMVWFRREVGVAWDDERVVLVCRAEYFPRQFREELEVLRDLLAAPPAPAPLAKSDLVEPTALPR